MKRGVLEITREEFNALIKRFDVRKFVGTTVANKVVAAMSGDPLVNVRLELSEEELEVLMDEVALPDSSDSAETISLRQKLTDMITRFRSVI
jgi:hypothetical protein